MTTFSQDVPRLDLSKAVKYGLSNPRSYTLRNSTHRSAHLDSLTTEYIGCKLLYDRHPYLQHTRREPKAKCLGPLVHAFERFANWANPRFQIQGPVVTFDKIDKANSTMNVAETFQFCQHFQIIPGKGTYRITKPETMALFAMTVNADEKTKYDTGIDFMSDFEKYKPRNSRDLTEQKFPFLLCRIAIVMLSRAEPSLSPIQKVQKFIERFKLNDIKYVKTICDNAKITESRRKSHSEYLHKKTGMTGQGAMGLEKLSKHLKAILNDVDLCRTVKPFYDLQLKTRKRDWVPFIHNHLNISRIHITNDINILKDYRYAIHITNKHPKKTIFFNIDPEHIPKYLTFTFKNKMLSPGMGTSIFIKFTTNHKLIRKLNGKRLRSHIPIHIMEKHHYLQDDTTRDRQNLLLQEITVPITASFQFIMYDDKDVFLPASVTTPRDYPIEQHVNDYY